MFLLEMACCQVSQTPSLIGTGQATIIDLSQQGNALLAATQPDQRGPFQQSGFTATQSIWNTLQIVQHLIITAALVIDASQHQQCFRFQDRIRLPGQIIEQHSLSPVQFADPVIVQPLLQGAISRFRRGHRHPADGPEQQQGQHP